MSRSISRAPLLSQAELVMASKRALELLQRLRVRGVISDAPEIRELAAILLFIDESKDYRGHSSVNDGYTTCTCGHQRLNHWHGSPLGWTHCGISDCGCGLFVAGESKCHRHNCALDERHECALCVAEDVIPDVSRIDKCRENG